MSVQTAADENLDKAADYIESALLCLNDIVVRRCWGSDEFTKERADAIEEAHATLLHLRKVLKS